MELSRLLPLAPPGAYKTYQVTSPLRTHSRPASCEEVGCDAYENGWITRVPFTATEIIEFLLSGVHGRHFTETTSPSQAEREFVFGAGQMCWKAGEHRVSLERPAIYRVTGGDWREFRGLIRRHDRPEHWVEDFAEHQDKIERAING